MRDAGGSGGGRPSLESHWGMRLLRALAKIGLYLPWIWLILFALFVLGAALQVGGWPTYGRPDPKAAGMAGLLYVPVLVLLLTVLATIPISGGLAAVKLLRGLPGFISKGEAVAYLAGLALLLLLTIGDLGGLMTWLGD